jgi:hypothetical protein
VCPYDLVGPPTEPAAGDSVTDMDAAERGVEGGVLILGASDAG